MRPIASTRLWLMRRAVGGIAVLAVLVLVAGALAGPVLGTVDGGCILRATSTSGGAVDLTTTRVWHLQSDDTVSVTGSAPSTQTEGAVKAYAFGFGLPVAGGKGAGTTSVDATDYEMSTFAPLGRVFAVAGSSDGPGGGCSGQLIIVLDDVNPFLTVLGGGGVVAIIVGLLTLVWATRNPLGVGRRIVGFIAMLLVGVGVGLVIQQTSTPAESASAIPDIGHSAFVRSVASPSGVSVDPAVVAQSAVLTLLVVLLLPFPSQLFNATLEENYNEIRRSVGRRRWSSWLLRAMPERPEEAPLTASPMAPAAAASWTAPPSSGPWTTPAAGSAPPPAGSAFTAPPSAPGWPTAPSAAPSAPGWAPPPSAAPSAPGWGPGPSTAPSAPGWASPPPAPGWAPPAPGANAPPAGGWGQARSPWGQAMAPLGSANAGRGADAAGRSTSAGMRYLMVAVVLFGSSLLYALLDPDFGLDARGLVTFAGIVLGLVAVTWAAGLPHRAIHRQFAGDRGRLWGAPAVLLVAALCVLISRLVGFQPGYVYGIILGFVFVTRLQPGDEARSWTAAAWWMLSLAVVAWLTLGAVRTPGLEASVPAEIVASVLAAVVVAGIEAIVFELVPVRFLPGEFVFRHRRVQWVVLYALGVFGFAWVILNPANGFIGTGSDGTDLFAAVALFLAFGLASVLFWGWFRFRGEGRNAPA